VQYFVEKYCHKMGKGINRIPKASLAKLLNYTWPGNVRELKHMIERCVIISSGDALAINDQCFSMLPKASVVSAKNDLQSVERDHIQKVLNHTNWKIEGSGGAASILNIHPSTLRFRLKKLDIKRPF